MRRENEKMMKTREYTGTRCRVGGMKEGKNKSGENVFEVPKSSSFIINKKEKKKCKVVNSSL